MTAAEDEAIAKKATKLKAHVDAALEVVGEGQNLEVLALASAVIELKDELHANRLLMTGGHAPVA